MTMPARRLLSILIASLAVAGASALVQPRSASACTCETPDSWGFLLERDLVMPADARGLLWAGRADVTERDFDVALVTEDGEQEVAFELVPVQYGLVLVRLARETSPGERYRFRTTRFNRWRSRSSEPDATYIAIASGRLLVQQIEVLVIDQMLELPDDELELRASRPQQASLTVGAPRSCSEEIDASQVRIEVVLPKRLQKFREHLTFRTLVDGNPWQPSDSVCRHIPTGRSWEGTGEDLVYAACPPHLGHPRVHEGSHRVAIQVAFAAGGGEPVLTRETTIELRCSERKTGAR